MIPLLIVLLSWIAIEIEVASAINDLTTLLCAARQNGMKKRYLRAMGPRADIDRRAAMTSGSI
jgi:hypothetical protein